MHYHILVRNKQLHLITVESPLIGAFLSDLYADGPWMNEKGNDRLIKFLNDLNDKEPKDIEGFGTYTDIFVQPMLVNKTIMLRIYWDTVSPPGKADAGHESFIEVITFHEILNFWIRERHEFEKDPEAYKQNMIRKGAIIIHHEDRAKDPEGYDKKVREAKHGVIEENRPSRWKFWENQQN